MAAGLPVGRAGDEPDRGAAIRRALAAAVIAVVGGALVFLVAPLIAGSIGADGDFGVNTVGTILWLSLALGGGLLLRQRPALDLPGSWAAALPLGVGGGQWQAEMAWYRIQPR